jgi:hypothetical protein
MEETADFGRIQVSNLQLLQFILFFFCVGFIPTKCYGQNLVQDSSFFFSDSLGKNKYWFAQGSAAPFINTGASYFYQHKLYAFDSLYSGISGFGTTHKDFCRFQPLLYPYLYSTAFYSEVIACELSSPLVMDSIYEIKLWLYPSATFSIPSVQVYFSDNKLTKSQKIKAEGRADLYTSDSSAILNRIISVKRRGKGEAGTFNTKWNIEFQNKWICISGKYKARGGERYFYIGNVSNLSFTAFSTKVRRRKMEFVPIKDNNPFENLNFDFDMVIDDVSVRRISISE